MSCFLGTEADTVHSDSIMPHAANGARLTRQLYPPRNQLHFLVLWQLRGQRHLKILRLAQTRLMEGLRHKGAAAEEASHLLCSFSFTDFI